MVNEGGLQRQGGGGDLAVEMCIPQVITADAVDTILAAEIANGVIVYTSFSAGRNLTTDTAANILALYPQLNVGESLQVDISSTAAFAGTFVAGVGVTLKGRATVPASSHVHVYITKTSATTVDWLVL
jgi:hypothetical protein